MTTIYSELAARFRDELEDLEQSLDRAYRFWPKAQQDDEEAVAFLDSVALNLHGFYSGLERLFVLVARHLDHALPTSDSWHAELLNQMMADRIDVRPAVISAESVAVLNEIRMSMRLTLFLRAL